MLKMQVQWLELKTSAGVTLCIRQNFNNTQARELDNLSTEKYKLIMLKRSDLKLFGIF